MQKTTKQQQSFRRSLQPVLKDFERNRQWADIGNWLYKLQQTLKGQTFSQLPEKLLIGKRLAQCLNPNLPPGVHGTALRIYEHILSNCVDRVDIFPTFSIGLFNFFEHSTSQLKFEVLKIIERYYVDSVAVAPMLVGLVNAIIPGLNENHEELARKIYAVFEKVGGLMGRRWVDGAVWVNVLKSPRTRIACFKYFQKSFKDRDKMGIQRKDCLEISNVENLGERKKQEVTLQAMQKDMIATLLSTKNEDSQATRFPNFPCLVMNALLACLSQGQLLVQRSALDLMISYISLQQPFFGQNQKQILVQACLHLLLRKQFQLTRRIYTYLFTSPDAEGKYTINQQSDPVIRIIEKALVRVLFEEEKNQQAEAPVLMLDILFKEHEVLAERMLPNIAFNLIGYVSEFYKKESKMEKAMLNFLATIQTKIVLFVDSILTNLDHKNDEQSLQVIKMLDFYYSILIKGRPEFANNECLMDVIAKTLVCIQLVKKDLEEYSFVPVSVQFLIKLRDQFKAQLPSQCIPILQQLIAQVPPQHIYASLLHLHPCPSHKFLLPYIQGGPLSLPTLTLLLSSSQPIQQVYLDKVFTCLFRLLDFHLWQDAAIELIKKFQKQYPKTYQKDIEVCDVRQWLVYWKRLNGEIKGAGVIRMLKSLNDGNPLKRHTSQTWLQQSSHIISKILQPVFAMLGTEQSEEVYIDMYHILRNIILNEERQFCVFLFSQKDSYLNVLLGRVFGDLSKETTGSGGYRKEGSKDSKDSGKEEKQSQGTTLPDITASSNSTTAIQPKSQPPPSRPPSKTASILLKSQIIQFIQFVLGAVLPDQKLQWIQLTFPNILSCLNNSIQSHQYQLQIQLLAYLSVITKTMPQLKRSIMSQLLQSDPFLKTILHGLTQTTISYVKTQYIKFLTELGDIIPQILIKKQQSVFVNTILERYSMLLRETDVSRLEQMIQGKKQLEVRRKMSGDRLRPRGMSSGDIVKTSFMGEERMKENNLEAKYSDTTNLWSGLKFYVGFSITQELQEFRVDSLLSLILNSFPFSYLTYRQYQPQALKEISREIQQQVKSVSGLRKQVLQIFDVMWKKQHRAILNLIIQKCDPRILIHASLDPILVFHSLLQSQPLRTVLTYQKTTKLSLPKSYTHYNRQILQLQNKLCYFAYLFLEYSELHTVKSKIKLWDNWFSFMKVLEGSPHTQTKLWLIQLLDLMFKKVSIKEMGLDGRARHELQEMVKGVLEELVVVVKKERDYTHKVDIKAGLRGLFSKEERDQRSYDLVRVFPPTVFELENSYQGKKGDMSYYIEEVLFRSCFDANDATFKNCMAIASCKTLATIVVNVVATAYEMDGVKMVSLTKEFLGGILPVCENKADSNQIYIELVSEILHKMVMSAAKTDIMKAMKKSIFEIYMGNDFFKCTKKTLSYWKDIINCTAEVQDILSDLLAKQTGLSGLFTGKAQSTRLKIKSFQRICFIIYAGKVDQYQNKLRSLLQSLNDVMRQGQTSHPALLILILFCIRILIIRLSANALNKMFKTIWPSLMTLLMQIFEKRKVARNPNLILAGLKVVELVTAVQLEEFNLLRWIFIFDYFGISLQTLDEQRFPQSFLTPFDFQPMLTNLLPKTSYKCTFIPVLNEKQQPATYEPPERRMIIKQPSVDSESELRNHAYMLVQYLLNLNQKRTRPNKAAIEAIIEADFISLDDYIFEIR